jgi:alpha-tubulin suppressor-like RCC1 family protein
MFCLGLTLVFVGLAAATAFATTPGVAGWGAGAEGELGDGAIGNASAFAPVSLLSEVGSVAAGGDFALAVLSGHKVMSWGGNQEGQLGLGTRGGEAQVPVEVPSLTGVDAVSAGDEQALALLEDGAVERWGAGELGLAGSSKPVSVAGIDDAVAIAAGSEDRKTEHQWNDLALLASGEVLAWGNGEDGQLGDGGNANSTEPVAVKNLEHATAIAAGDGQNLALLEDGTVMAWGENNAGQLGIGNLKNQNEPVPVPGLGDVVAIAAGDEDSLALLADGTVMAWGSDGEGLLGRSSAEGASDVPIPIAGLAGVTAIAAGARDGVQINGSHDLALLSDGTVMAWGGDKEGELGNEQEGGSSYTPVAVSGLEDVTGIAAGAVDGFAIGPPVPIVESIEPTSGTAGTKVRINGKNLAGATSVGFGAASTNAIESDGETSLTVTAPAEKPHNVAVTVTTAFHTSGQNSQARFKYITAGSLEFGRCVKVAKHEASNYKSGCTLPTIGGGYEWLSEIPKPGFTLSGSGTQELAGPGGALVICKGAEQGSGRFSGADGVANVTIVLTGCALGKSKHSTKCGSAGAAEGEIRTAILEGAAGFTNREAGNAALELLPAEGEALLAFTCGTVTTDVRGEAFGSISPLNKSTQSFKLNFAQSHGKQHIEGFQEGPSEVLEASTAGAPYEQIGLADSLKLKTEEDVELNSTR